jgi:trans-2,3-dihydro-3-hydroxyanthranilate isomerase
LTGRTLDFRIVNVFTRGGEPLSGNPLCVFEDGEGLSDALMQGLARQFNLSETTFLLPPTDPAAQARVRIFTPRYELGFAGHPTLGSASVCRSLGIAGDSLHLQMQAGVIAVSAEGPRWTLTTQLRGARELPDELRGESGREQLAQALGLRSADLAERPLWVDAGGEQFLVPLSSTAALERAAPRPELLGGFANRDGRSMAYVFAPSGPESVLARFFFPQGPAVLEDPATGSAAANLGGWWLAMGRPRPQRLQIAQGEQIGRPSTLYLHVDAQGAIAVGGEVIELARGRLAV